MENRTNTRIFLDALKDCGQGILGGFGYNGPGVSKQKLGSMEDANVYGLGKVPNTPAYYQGQQQFNYSVTGGLASAFTSGATGPHTVEPPVPTKKDLLVTLDPYTKYVDFPRCEFCEFFKLGTPLVPETLTGHAPDCTWQRDFGAFYIALRLEVE